MQIGIIGSGRMGSTLGKVWANAGHKVFLGARDPNKAKEIAETIGPNAHGGSLSDAATFGQAVLLATTWVGVAEAIHAAGKLESKVLMDCTLPLANRQLAVDGNTSGAEEIAKLVPEAKVVKAFNTIYYQHLERPQIGSERVSMFYCGDDEDAKATVAQLGRDIGLDVIDSGPLSNARGLEAMGLLWIYLAVGVGYGNEIGFRLLQGQ